MKDEKDKCEAGCKVYTGGEMEYFKLRYLKYYKKEKK